MKIFKTTPIEGDKLTAKMLSELALGETLTAECENIREFDATRQCAYYTKRDIPRPDGHGYKVVISTLCNTVAVTVVAKEAEKGGAV